MNSPESDCKEHFKANTHIKVIMFCCFLRPVDNAVVQIVIGREMQIERGQKEGNAKQFL